MKSLIAEGSELTLQEVPDAAIEKPTDAVVRMVLASVCGSDHHLLEYNIPMAYPIGHEAIGEVVEIGSDISGLTVGDRVLLAGDVGCGRCQPCRSGSIKRCKNGEFGIYGSPGPLGGCQSELIRVPFADFNALKIPEGITDEQALTITDCLPTAYTAVARANIRPGGTAAVIGIGPIGLIAGAALGYSMGPEVTGVQRTTIGPRRRAVRHERRRYRGPTRTTKPFAVADTTSTQCRSSGVFQRPPTFNIEPSLLETLAAGTSRSML